MDSPALLRFSIDRGPVTSSVAWASETWNTNILVIQNFDLKFSINHVEVWR